MWRRILIIAVLVVAFIGRKVWRDHQRSEREREAMRQALYPAEGSLSAELLTAADWDYEGPLGALTLRFQPDGKLVVIDGKKEAEGRWEIGGGLLSALIPGETKPHVATFTTSTDVLSGLSPEGLEPKRWTATRKKPQ